MSTSGPRIQNWQVLRPVTKLERNRKYIEIPAFEEACFWTRGCLTSGSYASLASLGDLVLDCWMKVSVMGYWDRENEIIKVAEDANNLFWLSFNEGGTFTIWSSVSGNSLYHDTDVQVPTNEWFHLKIRRTITSSTAYKLYINEILVETVTIAHTPSAYTTFLVTFADAGVKISNYRLWDPLFDEDTLSFVKDKHIRYSAAIYPKLVHNFWFNGSGESETVSAYDASGTFETDDYPPLVLGASYVPTQFEINADTPHSLKYPVVNSEADHALVVRWEDSSGEIQRKYLYKPEGVDVSPEILEYKGENLPTIYVLEVWNIDGASLVSQATPITLLTSITVPMSSYTDRSNTALTTLVEDASLAAEFPFVFPITFNQTQSFVNPTGNPP